MKDIIVFCLLLIFTNVSYAFSDGSSSTVDDDVDNDIRSLLVNINDASNKKDIKMLLSYFTDDFMLSIKHCGNELREFDKEGLSKMMNTAFSNLNEYVKQYKVESIQDIKGGFLARTNVFEVSTTKKGNQSRTTRSNEMIYISEIDGVYSAYKIDAVAVCR